MGTVGSWKVSRDLGCMCLYAGKGGVGAGKNSPSTGSEHAEVISEAH